MENDKAAIWQKLAREHDKGDRVEPCRPGSLFAHRSRLDPIASHYHIERVLLEIIRHDLYRNVFPQNLPLFLPNKFGGRPAESRLRVETFNPPLTRRARG